MKEEIEEEIREIKEISNLISVVRFTDVPQKDMEKRERTDWVQTLKDGLNDIQEQIKISEERTKKQIKKDIDHAKEELLQGQNQILGVQETTIGEVADLSEAV